jgi:hypothetical protein
MRKFFSEHKEYTHLLIYAEDIIATPDIVKLLIEDAEENNFPIISAYMNFDFKRDWIAISKEDLTKKRIAFAEDYKFQPTRYLMFTDASWFDTVSFVGLPLTLIRRDVVEKLSFKPYRYVFDAILGRLQKRGAMADLQFCLECKQLGIPIVIDKRAFVTHLGYTIGFINKKLTPTIKFEPKTTLKI